MNGQQMREFLNVLNESASNHVEDNDSVENEIHQMGREHGVEGKKYKTPGKVFAKLYNTQDSNIIAQYVEMYYAGVAAGKSQGSALEEESTNDSAQLEDDNCLVKLTDIRPDGKYPYARFMVDVNGKGYQLQTKGIDNVDGASWLGAGYSDAHPDPKYINDVYKMANQLLSKFKENQITIDGQTYSDMTSDVHHMKKAVDLVSRIGVN